MPHYDNSLIYIPSALGLQNVRDMVFKIRCACFHSNLIYYFIYCITDAIPKNVVVFNLSNKMEK